MVNEICYHTVDRVLANWEKLRNVKDYEKVAGRHLFQYLFENCPEAKKLFGFSLDMPVSDMLTTQRFERHSSYLIQMFDQCLGMLGPDIELLTEIMTELGEKHVRFGVRPDMYPVMGRGLIHALEILLETKFSPEDRDAWMEIFGALSGDMIVGDQKIRRQSK